MILVDASAWVEFLRGTGSRHAVAVRDGLRRGDLATTWPIDMEVLAGARNSLEWDALRSLLARVQTLPCEYDDYAAAADLFASSRAAGRRVRGLLDCLIASVGIRAQTPVLAADKDFETLAGLSPLQLA